VLFNYTLTLKVKIMSEHIRATLPYATSTGVQIGVMYRPKPEYEQDMDAYAMQLALLKVYPPPTLFQKIWRSL
jgi:hypothetical protein